MLLYDKHQSAVLSREYHSAVIATTIKQLFYAAPTCFQLFGDGAKYYYQERVISKSTLYKYWSTLLLSNELERKYRKQKRRHYKHNNLSLLYKRSFPYSSFYWAALDK